MLRSLRKTIPCHWRRFLPLQILLFAVAFAVLLLTLFALLFHGNLTYSKNPEVGYYNWLLFCESILGTFGRSAAASIHELLTSLETFGRSYFQMCASSIFPLIGLTGSFAWLVTAFDQKVLGVPIGQLLRWAYPIAIPYYFLCFLPTVFWGVIAADIQAPAALLLSLGNVAVQFIYLMFINIRLLLSSDKRELLVYSYYMSMLKRRSVNDKKFPPPAILHRTAECARSLLIDELRINSTETLELWHEAIKKLVLQDMRTGKRDVAQNSRRKRERAEEDAAQFLLRLQSGESMDGDIPSWMLKATDAWCVLLRSPLFGAQRQSAVQKMLYRLSRKTDADFFSYIALMAGLIVALFRLNEPLQDGGEKLWSDFHLMLGPRKEGGDSRDEQLIIASGEDALVFRYELTRLQQQHLIAGLGMAALLAYLWPDPKRHGKRSVLLGKYCTEYSSLWAARHPTDALFDSLWESEGSGDAMRCFSQLCRLECSKEEVSSVWAAQQELMLWLVEWAYRKEHGIPYPQFTRKAASVISQREALGDHVDSDPYFRSAFLTNVLQRVSTQKKPPAKSVRSKSKKGRK